MLTCAIAYAADYMHACVRAKVYAVWNANAAADGAGGSYTVCCSEGGMSDFVARTDEEWARPHNIFLIITVTSYIHTYTYIYMCVYMGQRSRGLRGR